MYLGAFETKVEDTIKFSSSKYRQSTANLKTYGFEIRFKTSFYDFLTTILITQKLTEKKMMVIV